MAKKKYVHPSTEETGIRFKSLLCVSEIPNLEDASTEDVQDSGYSITWS